MAVSGTRYTFQPKFSKKVESLAWPVVLPPHGPPVNTSFQIFRFFCSAWGGFPGQEETVASLCKHKVKDLLCQSDPATDYTVHYIRPRRHPSCSRCLDVLRLTQTKAGSYVGWSWPTLYCLTLPPTQLRSTLATGRRGSEEACPMMLSAYRSPTVI